MSLKGYVEAGRNHAKRKLSAWWKPVSTCIAGNTYLPLSVTVMYLYMLLQLNAFIKGMLQAAILVFYEMSLTSSVPCTHSPMPHIFLLVYWCFLCFSCISVSYKGTRLYNKCTQGTNNVAAKLSTTVLLSEDCFSKMNDEFLKCW